MVVPMTDVPMTVPNNAATTQAQVSGMSPADAPRRRATAAGPAAAGRQAPALQVFRPESEGFATGHIENCGLGTTIRAIRPAAGQKSP